jgi:prepilin-type N-terminal cleavage/methylation domain-containing protein
VPVRGYSRRAGFTLVEALMVVTLIGLIAAFAVPKLDFTRYRLNGAVRSVVSVLNRAQRMAVTDQSNVNVIFNLASQSITLHEDMDNDNQIDNGERTRSYPIGEGAVYGLGTSMSPRLYSPAPVTFTRRLNGMPELIFRRDGSASEAGAIYISSTRAGSSGAADTRSIEVTAATGRVEWYRYTGSQWERKF